MDSEYLKQEGELSTQQTYIQLRRDLQQLMQSWIPSLTLNLTLIDINSTLHDAHSVMRTY